MTKNQRTLLTLVKNSQYHDGEEPTDHPVWAFDVLDAFDAASRGGIVAQAVEAGFIGYQQERNRMESIIWITAAGMAALQDEERVA